MQAILVLLGFLAIANAGTIAAPATVVS